MKKKTAKRLMERKLNKRIAEHQTGTKPITKSEDKQIRECTRTLLRD